MKLIFVSIRFYIRYSSTRISPDFTALKTKPGKNLRKLVEQLKVQERKFDYIQLKGQVKGVEWSSDSHFKTLIDNAAKNLEKRQIMLIHFNKVNK